MNAPYVGGSASPPSTVFLYERSQTETDRESGTGQVRLITGDIRNRSQYFTQVAISYYTAAHKMRPGNT